MMATNLAAPGGVVLRPVLNLQGDCNWLPGPGHSRFALSPDAQRFVSRETTRELPSRKDPLRTAPEADWLVYRDLGDGHEIARIPFPGFFDRDFAVSRAGGKVIALRKGDDTAYNCDYHLWMWKPESDTAATRDYPFTGEIQDRDPGTELGFFSIGNPPLALSPDATSVAAFGHLFREGEGCRDEVWDDALGVIDLNSGKLVVIPLPVVTPPTPWRYWHLGWSGNGKSVYAILHGSYSGERPPLILYRLSPTTKDVVRIGEVPPTTIGFGPDDDLVIADTIGAGWGPHRSFALLPIGRLGKSSFADHKESMRFVQGLPMTEVVRGDDLEFESFLSIWVGRNRTYAEVVKRGATPTCTVLVELLPPIRNSS